MRLGLSSTILIPEEASKIKSKYQDLARKKKKLWALFTASLVINDLLMVGLAFLFSYFLRFSNILPIFYQEAQGSLSTYGTILLIQFPTMLLIYKIVGLYNRQNLLGGLKEYSLIFNATIFLMFVLITASFLEPAFVIARAWLLLDWFNMLLFTLIGRFGIRRIVYFLREQGYYLSPAIIVGANDEVRMLAEQFNNWRSGGLFVEGYISQTNGEEYQIPTDYLGNLEQLDDMVKRYHIEEIILASSALSREEISSIFMKYGFSNEINLRMSSGIYEMITTSLTIREIASVPLVTVNKVRLTGTDWILKSLIDYAITLPLVIVGAVFFLGIAIVIKLDSPGPVFHRRKVKGLNNSEFDALKFRTMYINGDEILKSHPELQKELAQNHKLKQDPRITKIGKFLRRFSLDELPQFFNVLAGQMSLVGPRMISPPEVEKYNQWGMNLLTVKPGITGLWQVSGRSDIGYDQRVNLDMTYIRNWSIWLDIYIILRTIPAMIGGRGAY